jgi:hypothetical protein
VVSGEGDADRLADEGDALLRHDEAAVLPDARAGHHDAGDAEEAERPVPEHAEAALDVQDDAADTDEGDAAPEAAAPIPDRLVPRFAATPEADGLTDYDQRFLDVMRLNLDRHGICSLKPADVADFAGIKRTAVGASISRLIRARRVVRLCRDSYRVSQRGASFPPASTRAPVAASISRPEAEDSAQRPRSVPAAGCSRDRR